MDVEIIDEDENPMLHRTDVRFELIHEDATPSRLSIRDSLAAKLNKGADEVVVHKLDTKYGMRKTIGYAKVYEEADHAQAVEQDYVLERNKITSNGETEPELDEESDEAAESDESEPEVEAEPEDEAEAEDESEAADEADADEEEDE